MCFFLYLCVICSAGSDIISRILLMCSQLSFSLTFSDINDPDVNVCITLNCSSFGLKFDYFFILAKVKSMMR